MDEEVVAKLKESGIYFNVMLGLKKMENFLRRELSENEKYLFLSGYSECFLHYLEAKERNEG